MVGTEGLELAPAIEAYLAYCRKARRLSHLTCSAYRTDLRAFQAIAGGGFVDRQVITGALEKIIENPEHKSGTIARRVVAVHGFLNWQDEVLAHQVFSRLKFKMVQPKRLPKTIPERELNLLFAGSKRVSLGLVGNEMHLILLLLAATGLRVSELCSLRLLDVDIERGELSVIGKGARERVVVIANETLRSALESYIEVHRDRTMPTLPLFCNKRGRAVTPKVVQLWLQRVAEVSGVRRRVTPHMFRHTAATLLVEEGVDIRFVQRLLGHASLSTTEIYTYVSDRALRTALVRADVMRGFMGPVAAQ